VKSNRHASDPFVQFLRDNPHLAGEIQRLHREGDRRLSTGNLRGALRCFKRLLALCPFAPVGHNNAGACYYYLGKYEVGAKHFQATLATYPDYVFALAMLARCQIAMGDRQEAARTLKRAVAAFRPSNPHRGDEATSVGIICDACAELEDDRGLLDFFWRHGNSSDLNWETMAKAGVAAFNLGRYSQAKDYWQRVQQQGAGATLTGPILAAELIEEGRIPAFRLDYRLATPDEISDPRDPAALPGTVKAFIVLAVWQGADEPLVGAFHLLDQNQDPWAEEFLWAILQQAELTTEVKTLAALALSKRGLIAADEPFQMNVDGIMRSVTLQDLAAPRGVNPRAFGAYHEGHILLQRGNLQGARESFLESLASDPTFVPAKLTLITICQQMGEFEEAGRLLDTLNVMKIDEEDRWLYWIVCGNQAAVEDRFAFAEWCLREARRSAPDEVLPHLNQLIDNLRKAAREAAAARLADRRRLMLGKPVHPDMSLEEVYHNLTKDNLLGMGQWRGLRALSRMNKDELVALLIQDLKDNWTTHYESLTDQERQALGWLQAQGGVALFVDFESKYGDPDDTLFWRESQPTSAAVGLWSLGWIGVGTWGDYKAHDVAESGQQAAVLRAPQQPSHRVIAFLPREVMAFLRSVNPTD